MTGVFILSLVIATPLAGILFAVSGSMAEQGKNTPAGYAFICGLLMMMLALTMALGLGIAWVQP